MSEKKLANPDDVVRDTAEAVNQDAEVEKDIVVEDLCDVSLKIEEDKSITLLKHGIPAKCPIRGFGECNSMCHQFFIEYSKDDKEYTIGCALSREDAVYHIPKEKLT